MKNVCDNTNYLLGKWLSSPSPDDEVVISGISGRLPNSHNVQEYFDNLMNKVDMTNSENRRWTKNHQEYPKRHGNLYEIDKADPGFFGLHYRQAHNMDPSIRILLETAIEAIFDAGFNPEDLKNTKTAVIVCVSWTEMEHEILTNMSKSQAFAVTGYLRSFQAHRISYFLKLQGPSYTLDSACSASLTAIDEAFRLIRSGICDNVIVGTTNLFFHPGLTLQLQRTGVVALDGITRVFDKDACGYARAEAVGSVFLQKQKNCRRKYTQIISCKQFTNGYHEFGISFPSTISQAELLKELYDESGKTGADLSYLEAHCTATAVGDAEEIRALDVLIHDRHTPLLIGSVKSNIGHTEPSSGFASLIKVILAMKTGKIPPNIHLKNIKPELKNLCNGSLVPVVDVTNLEKQDAIVGINNFGFGGTNAHLILRRFSKTKSKITTKQINFPKLVCLSARTKEGIELLLDNLKTKHVDWEYIALLHKIFRANIPGHLYRASWVLDQDLTPVVSVSKINVQLPKLNLFFGKFDHDAKQFLRDLLPIPQFMSVIKKITNLIQVSKIDAMNDLTIALAVQLGLLTLLNKIGLKFEMVNADYAGSFVSDFYHKNLSFEETIEAVASKRKIITSNTSKTFPKNSIVLNISNVSLKQQSLKVNDLTSFLNALGRLYEIGFNFELDKLYPKVQFPVSRETSIISSLIQWNHKKSWTTYNHNLVAKSESICQKFVLSPSNNSMLEGYDVNGSSLVPATEFLFLAWKTFAQNHHLQPQECPIVFSNCKFLKATLISKVKEVTVLITIQKTGNFEVLVDNSLVVRGNIKTGSNHKFAKFSKKKLSCDDKQVLACDDISKKLTLRGFNFSGLFKGLIKCNLEATVGLIKWEHNWMSFLANMMLIKNLQTNSRATQVPIFLKKLVIKPVEHLESSRNEHASLTIYAPKNCEIIRAGGVEMHSIQTKRVSKRKDTDEAVLDRYEFVPNSAKLSLAVAVRVNTQLVYENTLEENFKTVEVIDEFTKPDKFLLPLVHKVIKDMPYVSPNLKISTTQEIKSTNEIEKTKITLNSASKLLWIISTRILERPKDLQKAIKALKPNGFLLSQEDLNFKYIASNYTNLELFTEFVTETGRHILLKKTETPLPNTKYFKIDENLDWLEPLQEIIKNKDTQIVLYATNHQSNGLLGFVNGLRREPGGTRVKAVFTFDDSFNFSINSFCSQTQMAINVFKNGQRGTYRHLLLGEAKRILTENCFYSLELRQWRKAQSFKKSLENKVYAYYLALNCTKANIDEEDRSIVEYSGKNARNEKIFGFTKNQSLSTILTSDINFKWNLPDSWNLQDGATTSFAYSAAIYGLLLVAKIKVNSSILIHNATDSIGLAAIHICQHLKCDIFLTVETSEQKKFIVNRFSNIPEYKVGYTNSTLFEQNILKATNNCGVNTVLNTLSEALLEASIRCLAPGGALLQTQQSELENNNPLNMFLLKNEITFYGLKHRQIFEESEEIKEEIWKRFQDGIEIGFVKPLPNIVFHFKDADKAINSLINKKIIGKVSINLRSEENDSTILRPFSAVVCHNCNPLKSYIILGGLGGVGLELANWLFLRGARKIVLNSRSGIQTGYQTLQIKKWELQGATIRIFASDCASEEKCEELFEEANRLGPVDSIYNLATDLQDSMFDNQTKKMFELSLAPKAVVTRILDRVSRRLCPQLKQFVTFSSVSCGHGNSGITNYAMANSVMERICEKRKLEGLPGLSIQWGAIADVGIVVRMPNQSKQLVIGGTTPQKLPSFFNCLDRLLEQDSPVVGCRVVAKKNLQIKEKITLVDVAAKILGLKTVKTVGQHSNLSELGMDSMMIAEFSQKMEKDFNISLPTNEVRALTFAKLAEMKS